MIAQTFLGPVTRLKVVGPGADLIADVSTAKAATLPIGMRVTAALPATDARLLELSDEPSVCYPTSQIRPVREDAADAGAVELAHPRRLVHGVDERDEIERVRRGEPAPRDAAVREADGPGVARRANRDPEADVLARAEARAERARLLERAAAGSRRTTSSSPSSRTRALDDAWRR